MEYGEEDRKYLGWFGWPKYEQVASDDYYILNHRYDMFPSDKMTILIHPDKLYLLEDMFGLKPNKPFELN